MDKFDLFKFGGAEHALNINKQLINLLLYTLSKMKNDDIHHSLQHFCLIAKRVGYMVFSRSIVLKMIIF